MNKQNIVRELMKLAKEINATGECHPDRVYKWMEAVFSSFGDILKEADKLSEEQDIEFDPIYSNIQSIKHLLDLIIKDIGGETFDSDRKSFALERMADSIRKHIK